MVIKLKKNPQTDALALRAVIRVAMAFRATTRCVSLSGSLSAQSDCGTSHSLCENMATMKEPLEL